MDILLKIQKKDTKVTNALEHLSHEERMKMIELLRL